LPVVACLVVTSFMQEGRRWQSTCYDLPALKPLLSVEGL